MREAVAAIFVYGRDVFVIRRQNYLRAFPGYYAFPGGKVDAEDAGIKYTDSLLMKYPAHQVCALIRK